VVAVTCNILLPVKISSRPCYQPQNTILRVDSHNSLFTW